MCDATSNVAYRTMQSEKIIDSREVIGEQVKRASKLVQECDCAVTKLQEVLGIQPCNIGVSDAKSVPITMAEILAQLDDQFEGVINRLEGITCRLSDTLGNIKILD